MQEGGTCATHGLGIVATLAECQAAHEAIANSAHPAASGFSGNGSAISVLNAANRPSGCFATSDGQPFFNSDSSHTLRQKSVTD